MKDINLIPHYVIIQRRNVEMMKWLLVWGIIIAVVFVLFLVFVIFEKWLITSDITRINNEIELLKPLKFEKELVEELENDIDSKDKICSTVDRENKLLPQILEGLQNATPTGVKFSQVNIDSKQKKITLSGKAEAVFAITDLINSLNSSGMFSGAFINSINANKALSETDIRQAKAVPFNLQINYTDKGGE